LESRLEQETTLTPSAHFGTSPVASGNIEAQNIQDPSLVASNAPSPLTEQAPLETTSSNAGTSPSTSNKKSEAIASSTQTRY